MEAPSPHVTLHVLLTHFQTGLPSLVVDALLVAVAVAYLAGARALVRRRAAAGRGRPWPASRTACWLAGVAAVFVAVGSGLAAYDDLNPSAHVVQHVLLMMVAPPLLLLGRPVTLLVQAMARPVQTGVVRFLGSRAVQALTGPFAWPLYYGSMAAYFLTPAYAFSVRTPTFHDFTHGWFLAVGCCFWAGIVAADLPGRRRSPTGRLMALLVGMPVESAIAVALIFWPWPLAPGQPAHAAGIVLWVGAMLTSGVGLALVISEWARADARAVRRSDAALAAAGGGRVGHYTVRADGSAVPVVSVAPVVPAVPEEGVRAPGAGS